MCVHSPDATQDWNGSAFVTASNAAKNACGDAIGAGTESPSGTYTFTFPVGITTPGVYPFTVYRQLGGSLSVATDTRITPPADENTVTISVGAVTPTAATYTPTASWTGTRQTARCYRGQGLPVLWTNATSAPVDQDEYEATLGVVGSATFVTYSVANGNMTVVEATGAITVNPTEAHTLALSLYEPTVLDLWRTGSDDTRTVVGRLYLTVTESNNP